MKIFRVHLTDASGMSLGFEYYSNKKDALTALKKNQSDEDIRVDRSSIEEREIVIGKYEFLKLLNEWAKHPDNG
jgi:5-hydroxyisourate hydrolase-like protein (transthyretin family)